MKRDEDKSQTELIEELHELRRQLRPPGAVQQDASADALASAELMRTIAEHSLVGVLIAQGYRVRYVNAATCAITGYSSEDMLAWGPEEYARMVHPADRALVMDQAKKKQTGATDVRPRYRWRLVTRSGAVTWVETLSHTVTLGDHPADLVSMVDVSAQQVAEQELHTANEMLRLVLDTIHVRVFWKDRESRYLGCNAPFAHDAGEQSPEALIGRTDFDMGWRDQAELYRRDDAAVMSSGQSKLDYEEPQTTPDGQRIWLRTSKAPLRNADGEVVGLLGTYQDITTQLRMEEQLHHSQRMDAIGQLAGGVAHDFNNMLAGIHGYAEILAKRLADNADLRRCADNICAAADRAASLTAKLLAFSRQGRVQSVPVDVNDLLAEAVALLERTIDRRIVVETRFTMRKAIVLGDPAQLQTVFLNLGVNARDAMPHGGRLCVATNVVDIDRLPCDRPETPLEPGSYIEVVVTDTGVGIPDDVVGRIFEPFFTTKEVGQGTGLGLAAVYGAVREHHGRVLVDSRPGQGSSFRVLLPLTTSTAVATAEPPSGLTGGSETVLLVDDEPVVREMTEKLLRNLGYQVVAVCDGVEAIEAFRAPEARFDVVVLDMVMPKQGGEETFHLLREIDPQVKVLAVSGFGRDVLVPELLGRGGCEFLQKPFSYSDLARTLRKALRGGAATPATPALTGN